MSTPDELIDLFKNATEGTLHTYIELTADLDFSGFNLTLPLGVLSDKNCVTFSGMFQGNGHSIMGIVMDDTNKEECKNKGLFCNLKNATVENLVIDSSCSFTGYSAGALSASVSGSLTIKNVTNKAAVSGQNGVGGFIGVVECRQERGVISLEDCINEGTVTTSGSSTGGFVGEFYSSPGMTLVVSNSTNNGNVKCDGNFVGGFVGEVTGQSSIIISSTINNGLVTGYRNVGGFVGYFVFLHSDIKTQLFSIINSVNKGNITGLLSIACGFVCVNPETDISDMNTTIKNSINKGSVKAVSYAYGIANIITVARNVVSMGEVSGSSGSYTFWDGSIDVESLFCLNSECLNCSFNATFFQNNTETGFYEVINTSEHVDDLLNNEAVNKQFGMVWSSELDLVFAVNVSGMLNKSFLVKSGTPMNDVGTLSFYFNNNELCIISGDSQPRVIFKPTHLVSRNMNIVVGKCVNVSVGVPINKSETMVIGERIEQLAWFLYFSLDEFVVVDSESGNVLGGSSMIEKATLLKLYHNVIVSGALSKTLIAEHGTKLGKFSDLTDCFNSSFIVYHENDKNSVITNETVVLSDIIAVVTKFSQKEIIIKFDENENITEEEIKNAIKDLVDVPNDEVVWIEVISEGDNSFIISVKQTGTEEIGVDDSLKKCSLSKS